MKDKIFYTKKQLLLLAFVSLTVFVSCEHESLTLIKPTIESSTDPNQQYPVVTHQVKYNEMISSDDIKSLIYDETNNPISLNTLKDSVVLFVEGGPKHLIDFQEFGDFKSVVLSGFNGMIDPTGFPNHSFVGMHQMHEVNPTVFGSGTSFTLENADQVNNQTLDMIEKVINWLKSKNKVVFLFGHSNGSFMVQNYLVSNRTKPSYSIISGSRLKTIPDMLNNYLNFIDFSYTNGTILNTTAIADIAKPYFNVLRYLQINHNKNYINLLANNPMLPKTFYSLSENDEALGRISIEEENFINNNCPHVYFSTGGHAEAALGIIYALQLFRN